MYRQNVLRYQEGIVTLATTLILLFLATLVALYTAKTSIKEQQISANQYRADQSLSTGNGALDWGIAYYSKSRGVVCEKDTGRADCLEAHGICILNKELTDIYVNKESAECEFIYKESDRLSDPLSTGTSEMYYAYVDAAGDEYDHIKIAAGATPDIYSKQIKIYGIGHSDDDTGMRTVSVDVNTFNLFGPPGLGGPAFPLITKRMNNPNGNMTIINRFANRSVWSGSQQTLTGSVATYILDAGLDWNCNDIANHNKCVSRNEDGEPDNKLLEDTQKASDGQDNINADIIDADPNLDNLTPDQFFENFFGRSKAEVKKIADEMGHVFPSTVEWASLNDKMPLVWIDATAGDYDVSGDVVRLGTEADPMVLIVDGNLKIGGVGNDKLQLVGLLYVTGTWDASANMTVQGQVIVETSVYGTGAGGPTLIYDADLFGGKLGPPPGTLGATVPGTWKDWE